MDQTSLIRYVDAIWPSTQGRALRSAAAEDQVKHAAATFLVGWPHPRAISSDVAEYVRLNVGSVKQLGIQKKLREVLAEDPCFIVEDSKSSEAYIKLNKDHLVMRGSAVHSGRILSAAEQQQQQQNSQLQTCTAAHKQRLPGPYSAVNTLYPLSGGSVKKVLHIAAKHLLDSPKNRAHMSSVEAAVQQQVGQRHSVLVQQLLAQETIFKLESIAGSTTVKLDVPMLQRLAASTKSQGPVHDKLHRAAAEHQAARSSVAHGSNSSLDISSDDDDDVGGEAAHSLGLPALGNHSFPVANADASSSSITTITTARQLLLYVMRHQWHSNPQLNLVRRALAVHLIQQANATVLAASRAQVGAADGPACGDWGKYSIIIHEAGEVMLKAWRLQYQGQTRCYSSIKEALEGDKYLSIFRPAPHQQSVRLDITQIAEDAAAVYCRQPHSANSTQLPQQMPSSSSSGGSNSQTQPASTSSEVVTAHQLLQYASSRTWHATNPQLNAVRRTIAMHIIRKVNAAPLLSDAAAVESSEAYVITGSQAGPIMRDTLLQQFPGERQCWANTTAAFAQDMYFTTCASGVSERSIKLNIHNMILDTAMWVKTQGHLTDTRAVAAVNQTALALSGWLQSPPPPSPAAPALQSAKAAAAATASDKEVEVLSARWAGCPPPPPPPPPPPALQPECLQAAAAAPSAVSRSLPARGAAGSTDQQQHGAVQLMASVSVEACAAAEVTHVAVSQQHQLFKLDGMLQHLEAAKLAAWQFVLGDSSSNSSAVAHRAGSSSSSSSSSKKTKSPVTTAISAVHVFAPAAAHWPSAVYVVDFAGADTAATVDTVNQLQRVLENSSVLKVLHDVRHVSVLLQQQYGIKLTRTLDTQLLAGVTALSSGYSSSCSNNLGRRSLQELLLMYGWPCNQQYDEVRYLLALAHRLLQQLPDTIMAMADLQTLLTQQQQRPIASGSTNSALQLTSELLPAYGSLITDSSSNSRAANNTAGPSGHLALYSGAVLCNTAPTTSAAGTTTSSGLTAAQGLVQMCFELKVDHQQAGGWFRSTYELFINDKQHAGDVIDPVADAAEAAAEHQPLKMAEHDNAGQAPATAAIDEAVHSIMLLLPERLHPHLLPYTSKQQQPALMEVIIDADDVVKLRLSDKTTVELDVSIDITEALSHLAAAKHLGKQQKISSQGLLQQTGYSSSERNLHEAGNEATAEATTHASGMSSRKSSGSLLGLLSSRLSDRRKTDTPAAAAATSAASSNNPNSMDAAKLVAACGFGSDNRMGVPGTLHRISAIRDRQGVGVTGLTYRIGRDVRGVAGPLADILSSCKASLDPESDSDRPRCVLLLGRPGVGKTTLLRNVAYLLSVPYAEGGLGLSVIIVDTSNEIAGDSEERHPCIGRARRMMVRRREEQANVLIEAVQNHTPDVIIVDEIGTKKEVEAAKTIAQRGVVLIATAHGTKLGDLLRNPTLRDLVGGVTAVTLGDTAAEKNNSGRKTRIERAGAATFNTLVELRTKQEWCLHLDVEKSVDSMLHTGLLEVANESSNEPHQQPSNSRTAAVAMTQTRVINKDTGRVMVKFASSAAAQQALDAAAAVDALAAQAPGTQPSSTASADGAGSTVGESGSQGGTPGSRWGQRGFAGAWLVDLMHAAVHVAIAAAAKR